MASDPARSPSLWASAGGDLPSNWTLIAFEELLQSPKSIAVGVMYPGEQTNGGVPLIRVGDVRHGGIVRRPSMSISPNVHEEYRRTEISGDELLITLVGAPGVCVLARPEMKGWNVARAIAVARMTDPGLRPYVKAVMESSVMRNIITGMLNTTVQPTLNLKEIKVLPLPMPHDLQVARALGDLAELFNQRIELLYQTSVTLEAIVHALFKSWFVDFDPVQVKSEGRQPEGIDEAAAALFPSEFQDSILGPIPKGWQISEIGRVAECVGGGTPSTKQSEYWEPALHRWATPKDLSGLNAPVLLDTVRGLSDAGLAKVSSGLLPVGTLLMSSRAPIGYIALAQVPLAINQGFIAMKPGGQLAPEYLYFWCHHNMDAIKQKANGSTFMEISKAAFRPIPLVVPSTGVVERFQAFASSIFKRIAGNERERHLLGELRDTLIPRLISGKLQLPIAEESSEATSSEMQNLSSDVS